MSRSEFFAVLSVTWVEMLERSLDWPRFLNVVLQLMNAKKNKYIQKYACQRNVFMFYKKVSLMFRFILQSAISKLNLLQ